MFNFPLQAGDTGVKQVDSLTLTTTMTSGTARVMIGRRVAEIPVTANVGFKYDVYDLGMPRVYDSAALMWMMVPNSTSSGPTIVTGVIAQG